jgi:hypothetical protein
MPRVYRFLLDHKGDNEDTPHNDSVTMGISTQGSEFQVPKRAKRIGLAITARVRFRRHHEKGPLTSGHVS